MHSKTSHKRRHPIANVSLPATAINFPSRPCLATSIYYGCKFGNAYPRAWRLKSILAIYLPTKGKDPQTKSQQHAHGLVRLEPPSTCLSPATTTRLSDADGRLDGSPQKAIVRNEKLDSRVIGGRAYVRVGFALIESASLRFASCCSCGGTT